MSNSSDTCPCAIEKWVKHSQNVVGASSKAKKPHACKIALNLPPPIPSDEEEEEPLHIHSLEELPGGQRRLVNYMKEDQKTITTQRDTPCYEFHKVGPDHWFWCYFHID
jgi:hypothetical protein